MTETRPPPPGWYLDPTPGLVRWWDGTTWTDRIAPATPQGSPDAGAPTRARSVSALSVVAVAVAGLTVVVWALAVPCAVIGTVAIAWERHTGNNATAFGAAALVVAGLAGVAAGTFDSSGLFF